MNWHYRKSIKGPLGTRINVSDKGIGYSWGFSGYRRSLDASGRQWETFRIPGTGFYARRRVPENANARSLPYLPPKTQSHGCLLFLIVAIAAFLILYSIGAVLN